MFFAIAFIVVFFAVVVAAARSGASSVDSSVGLFSTPTAPARPRGTQEHDLAPFSFR